MIIKFDDRLILLLLDELTSRDPTRMRESERNPEHEGTLKKIPKRTEIEIIEI